MEFLPEDPQKRKLFLIGGGVVAVVAVIVIALQFTGESVTNDPAAAAAESGIAVPADTPPPTTGEIGGARRYNGN
jgi:hypothetical protein